MVIRPLDKTDPAIARAIHNVRQLAYSQEARLLGIANFPPLSVTPEQLQGSEEQYFGALEGSEIFGVVGLEPEGTAPAMLISCLAVAPRAQRTGIGRSLVLHALAQASPRLVWVQTAKRNEPAVALYRRLGFEIQEQWALPTGLELVRLLHSAGSISVAA